MLAEGQAEWCVTVAVTWTSSQTLLRTELSLLSRMTRYQLRDKLTEFILRGAEAQLHGANGKEVFCLWQLFTMQLSKFETFWKLKGRGRPPKHLHVGGSNRLRKPRGYSLFLNNIFVCLKHLKENVCPVILRRYLNHDKQSATSQKIRNEWHRKFSAELYTYANSICRKEKSFCTVQSLWISNSI